MPKDYYIVLGISKGANLNQIKKAYRKVAKKYHPDVTQSEDDERFREIKEAYETLADEAKRRKYDAELQSQDSPIHITSVPETIQARTSIFKEMNQFESLIDEFFEGFVPGVFTKERYRAPKKDLYYEVILSPSEAHHGGLFPIKIPVIEPCPQCSRSGLWDDFYCPVCYGYGRIDSEREFSISIPPRTAHGTEVTLSLEDIGLIDVNLYVLIQVDPSLE